MTFITKSEIETTSLPGKVVHLKIDTAHEKMVSCNGNWLQEYETDAQIFFNPRDLPTCQWSDVVKQHYLNLLGYLMSQDRSELELIWEQRGDYLNLLERSQRIQNFYKSRVTPSACQCQSHPFCKSSVCSLRGDPDTRFMFFGFILYNVCL